MPLPPIYIINLKRTPERKLYMQRQLDAFNLSYQFVDAVDKHLLQSEEYRTTIANQLGIDKFTIQNNPSASTAIRLSHIKVYNLMIKNNIPVACVLEDDAFLLPSFPKILNVAQRVSWDVLMLTHSSRLISGLNPGQLSPYRFFRKFIHYRKNYLTLNSFTTRLIMLNAIKVYYLKYIRHQRTGYYPAYKIGAIPDKEKSNWYKATSDHYIASPCFPSPRIDSTMAYLLTLQGAIKWKEIALRNNVHMDTIPHRLYNKREMNLRLVVPPCCLVPTKYLKYSARIR